MAGKVKYVQFNTRVDINLLRQAKAAAAKIDRPLSIIIRDLLREFVRDPHATKSQILRGE